MRKLFATFLAVAAMSFSSQAQLVITEIMYNPPESGIDSLEYIEFVNNSGGSIDLNGYTLSPGSGVSGGLNYTFTAPYLVADGDYVVIAANAIALNTVFGITAFSGSGALTNSTKSVVIKDGSGTVVDSVKYDDGAPWPTAADGNGPSIVLCNLASDNTNGANWIASAIPILGAPLATYGTPGSFDSTCTIPVIPASYPVYTFAQINSLDASGVADSTNVTCELRAIAHCVDLNGGVGVEFPFSNSNNNSGIRVRIFSDINNYSVLAGDSLHILGTIEQYNGLLIFIPDSIGVISQGNTTAMPMTVITPTEMTENKLITLIGVHLVDPSEWMPVGTGFNVRVTDGSSDTSMVRIDNDIDLFNQPAPTGTFNITGWGGQFDFGTPHDGGYQLQPCSMNMITGTTKLENNSYQVAIFPNPTSTVLNIRSDVEIQTIAVYNTLGQEVITKNNVNTNLTQVNTASLENGVYVISIVTDKKIMTQQFQVVK
jgi:hypothetical protein